VKNLAHSASFHSRDKTAPSNPGIKHPDDPDDCIEAAIALLDRGWGKPPQAILAQVDAKLTLGGIDAPPMINETDTEWLARRRAELVLIPAETKVQKH
jgi:hypothetical protein